ncbi:hypothetical protein [Micromonospora sp. LOL_023]
MVNTVMDDARRRVSPYPDSPKIGCHLASQRGTFHLRGSVTAL